MALNVQTLHLEIFKSHTDDNAPNRILIQHCVERCLTTVQTKKNGIDRTTKTCVSDIDIHLTQNV